MRLSVLIVDDEPHARRHIKRLLNNDNEVEVIYECKNGKEVLNFLKSQTPAIIFLDINMPGISGVEVATKLKKSESLIIFSTAYDEYALKAFELEAFDYLLKPFEDSRFNDVLQRAKKRIESNSQAQFGKKFVTIYNEYSKAISPHLTYISLKNKGFEQKIHVDEVLFLEASSVYVVLHLKDKKELYRTSLNLLEQQLPDNFIRIHRSFIVNVKYVSEVKYLNNSTYQITLINDVEIISSRRYQEVIKNSMQFKKKD